MRSGAELTDEALEARRLVGEPTAGERARLEQIFPTGVCDYTKDDLGRPTTRGH